MTFRRATLLATTVLASFSALAAQAADYKPASAIDAVTVYPLGADVTRTAAVKVEAGEHRLIIENLPGSIDPQSVRIAGEAGQPVEISSVDTKVLPLTSADADARRRELEKQVAALYEERSALDQAIGDADTQRQFLLSLANKQLTPGTTEQTSVTVDGAALNGLLDVMGQRLSALARVTQEARLKQKDIDEQVADLQKQMALLSPNQDYRTSVTVHFSAATANDASFRISYRVPEAGWQPYYDARLTTPAGGKAAGVELVRRAEVVQSTAENWTGVKLTLSTARPNGATQAPEIDEKQIAAAGTFESQKFNRVGDAAEAPAAASPAKEDSRVDELAKMKVEGDAKGALVEQAQAEISFAGFHAVYDIASRVDIDNSGTSKKVRIASGSADATLEAITVPRLDANAYLTAKFVIGGSGPVLPGSVNLYRDGVYVGQGALPQLNPTEEAKLGFGIDDLVKVQRAEVKRRTGEEGLLTSSNVEERVWDITVKNLHGFTLPVSVLDRIPFSARDDVTVSEIGGLTPVTERDVEKRRGVIAWRFDLEPQKDNVIRTGYKVSWPKSVEIGMLE